MGNLKVKPIGIYLAGEKYNVLFTTEAIYEIQEHFKEQIYDIIKRLRVEELDICKTVLDITKILVKTCENKEISIKEIIEPMEEPSDILKLMLSLIITWNKSCSLEKIEDDDIDFIESKTKEIEEPDLCERLFTIGHIIGYKDDQIWKMTPRQLFCMHRDYIKYKTGDKPKQTIDDIL